MILPDITLNTRNNSVCSSLCRWSQEWKLNFNGQKCVHIKFSRQSEVHETSYHIKCSQINIRNSHRDLGIIFSSDLSWKDHYDKLLHRAYTILGLVRRTFNSASSAGAKKNLYVSLIRSQLTYGSVFWRPQLKKDIVRLESIQRRATKFILNDYTSD